jgi:predicted phage terminase large subunit-like protein
MKMDKIGQLLERLAPGDQERLLEQLNEYKMAVERERCQDSFMSFVKKMWPGFIHGRHHAVMAKAFEDIASGKLKRLAISMPPRHTKSQFGSYLFPAWFLGKFPNKKIIQASNTAELAVGFGRNVRNLVMSDQYADVFPDVRLRQDSKAAGRWSTNHGGEAFSIGVGGTMTGRGGDCLVGNTMIMTYNGLKRIDEIKPNEYVLSYCEASHRSVYRKVIAVAQRQAFATYQVRDRHGNMVEATGNHRIYYEGGWAKAETIAVGGSVLSYLPEFFSEGAVRVSEKISCEPKLQSSVQPKLWHAAEEFAGRDQVCSHMQELRKGNVGQPTSEKGLLGRVQERAIHQARAKKSHGGRKALRYLRRLLQACNKYVREQMLLHEVQERSSRNGDEGSKQSWLEGRHFTGARKVQGSTRFSIGQASRTEDGWGYVRGMQLSGESGGSSHQPQPAGQQVRELGNFVQEMSLPAPCNGEKQPQASAVSMVERVRHPEGVTVYDIEVEGTHNFFANGILVHNCVIIDDPHDEQTAALAMHNPELYDKTYEWYTSGPRQRLQPNGAIIIIATRWSERDLIGRVLKDAAERGKEDEWRYIEFPAILPSGKPLWPEYWSLEELEALKAELPPNKWNAQYQQRPTGEEGAIIKREWWQRWKSDTPPPCEFIIQAWDTAYTKGQRNDYSACTTWGVFDLNDNPNDKNIILLDRYMERLEFPDLKIKAKELYEEWQPDSCIVEAKASGLPLIYELRQMGLIISDYTPTRGTIKQSNDKIARVNAIADIVKSGKVWAPETRWADELINNMAAFPNAAHDDDVDTAVMALSRFRQGGFLRLETDYEDNSFHMPKKAAYY